MGTGNGNGNQKLFRLFLLEELVNTNGLSVHCGEFMWFSGSLEVVPSMYELRLLGSESDDVWSRGRHFPWKSKGS